MAKLIGMQALKDANNLVEPKSIVTHDRSYPNQTNHVATIEMLNEFGGHERKRINVAWQNLSYHVTTGFFRGRVRKDILQGVTGYATSGMLTVVIGPSGAGKTTLLNIISGFKSYSHKGEVLINGKRRSQSFYRAHSCFIPQDTYLYPYLTVKETVRVAAELKLPSSTTKAQKEQEVDKVIKMLRLTHVQSSKINPLSAGEKKRLFIAQELVSNPPMILLDEPTSGLDSSLSYQCISLLLNLAREGRTIICTVHQPSSAVYEMFDNVYVLSKGYCIYSGLGKDMTTYLSSCGLECPQYYNPSDYIIDVASGVRPGEEILLKKRNEDEYAQIIQMTTASNLSSFERANILQNILYIFFDKHRYPTNFFHRFWILIWRQFWSAFRQPMLTLLCLVANVALAGLIGMVYRTAGWNADIAIANVGLLALITIFLAFSSILPTLLTFPTEKIAIIREYHNGWYSVNSYFLAKTISGIPFNCIFPLIFVSIVYWLTEQINETWRYLYFIALSVCLTVTVESIPLIVGALCSPKVTVFLVPALCLPLLIFSNFFIIGNKLPYYLDWLSKISPFALFYQGIMMVIYGFDRPQMKCHSLCLFSLPQSIMTYLEIDEKYLNTNIETLCISFVILRFIGYVVLNVSIRKLKLRR